MAQVPLRARTSARVVTAAMLPLALVLVLGACGGASTSGVGSPTAHSTPGPASSGPVAPSSPVRSAAPARPSVPVTPPAPGRPAPLDPASWASRQLAAELVMTGAKMGDAAAVRHAAEQGVAGVVLFGPSSSSLARTLRKARAAAPTGNPPLIASDEEGGQVQRLASLIHPLPSAETMGLWSPSKLTTTARGYALKMKALGVDVALGPDADLAVPGYYIAAAHRSFSNDPQQAGADVSAWTAGLTQAGVLGVVKHWPGHGQATDTHVGGSTVPAWSDLMRRDLIPFEIAFEHGTRAVMVGHLRVPGLTEGSLPASESRAAMRALRAQAGAGPLIVTDDLSMAAASKSLGVTGPQAAVRAIAAGADVAMVCWSPVDGVISAVARAIDDGRIPHDQALASARRVLLVKTWLAASR